MSPTMTTPSPSTSPAAERTSRKVLVRHRTESRTAVRLTEPLDIVLPNGLGQTAQPGEWLIYNGPRVIDRLTEKVFQQLYEPVQNGLVVTDTTTGALEELLGPGSTKSEIALLAAVQRVVLIKIGGVDVKFNPGQLEEIATRAAKNGTTVQAEVERVVAHLSSEVFWNA